MTQQEQERQAIDHEAYDRDIILHAKIEANRQAIEFAANNCVVNYYNNVGGYYKDPVLTNADKMRLMFRFGAEFSLSELRKPSEELVQEIIDILAESNGLLFYGEVPYETIAEEIAKLLPSYRIGENGVNVELLKDMYEALIIARNRIKEISPGYPREIAICISEYERISNAEKQINQ